MAVAQSTRARSRERFTLDERQYRRIAYAALFTLTLIIFTGAAVRLTGSGLGCPQWPRCNDRGFLPPLSSHQLIEFGNRMVTGVVGLPCLLAAVGAYRLRPFRPELRWPALILVAGIGVEALIGGATVLLELSWEVVILHYVTTCALLIAAAVLVWRVQHGPTSEPVVNPRQSVLATRALTVYGGLVLVLGSFATAAGPHAGGAGTGDYVDRMHGIALDTMIKLHGHPAAALGFLTVGAFFLARHQGASSALQRALGMAALLVGAQGVLGLIQYYNALPAAVVWGHASLAAVLWLTLVFASLAAGRPRAS